jgi:hypothetical protein
MKIGILHITVLPEILNLDHNPMMRFMSHCHLNLFLVFSNPTKTFHFAALLLREYATNGMLRLNLTESKVILKQPPEGETLIMHCDTRRSRCRAGSRAGFNIRLGYNWCRAEELEFGT